MGVSGGFSTLSHLKIDIGCETLDISGRNSTATGRYGPAGEKAAGGTVVNHFLVNRYDEMEEETVSMEGNGAVHTAVSLVVSERSPAASSFLGREAEPYGECAFATDHREELPGVRRVRVHVASRGPSLCPGRDRMRTSSREGQRSGDHGTLLSG